MSNSKIEKVRARQIFDSLGRPAVEVDVWLRDGSFGRADVASGIANGAFEARELPGGGETFYDGSGVLKAVERINGEIADELENFDALDQREADDLLCEIDGSGGLKRLGENAASGVSAAIARAAAHHLKMPLYRWIAEISDTEKISMPLPMVTVLSGGLLAGKALNAPNFLFVPVGAKSLDEALFQIAKVRSAANQLAREKKLPVMVAGEAGLSSGFETEKNALEFMVETFERAGLKPFEEARIAIDAAARVWRKTGNSYFLSRENRAFSPIEMIETIEEWSENFPLFSIEDALDEEDWKHWEILTGKLGARVQIIGGDLFATNLKRVEKGIAEQAATAVLIKPNQNGTLTGTLDVIEKAKKHNYKTIVSARSGETEDTFIADLAVGTNSGQIKIGSFRHTERLAKYNQLIRLAEETGAKIACDE